MRILQIHTAYRQPGGEETVVDDEARLLREAGHDVVQELARNSDHPATAATNLALAPWNPYMAHRVREAVQRFRPDLAHVHNTWFTMSPAVIWAARAERVPVVMTLHNYRLTCANGVLYRDNANCRDCLGASPWPAIRHTCYRGSRVASAFAAATIALHRRLGTWSERVDMFIALSESQRDLMIRAGLAADRVVVKPHSVPDPGPRSTPPSASKVVLFVGRLSKEKGVDSLVEAWRAADTGDLELLLIGDGPLRDSLSRELPPGVRMVGLLPRARVLALMLKARALVFPSWQPEPFGLVAAEAMAAGLPVLTAATGAGEELAPVLGPAWIISSESKRAFADALSRLHELAAVDTAGALSRGVFERCFEPHSNLQHLLATYAVVLRASGTPGSPHE